MDAKKLIVGALAATALTVGGGAALAAGQAPEATTGENGQEQEETSYKGSIQAPAEKTENETAEDKGNQAAEDQQKAAEAQQLQSLAKIDQNAAEQAALQAVPGTVNDVELGNENGYVVYEAEVAGNDGKLYEVKVDAGNGQVLQQQAEDGGSEQDEANEGPEQSGTNETGGTAGR